MLQREQLEAMKVDDLRRIFKERGISYYVNGKRMVKAEMITRYMAEIESQDEIIDELTGEDELKAGVKYDAERMERKMQYVEQAVIGSLVAFKVPGGKVISAMITKKSTSRRMFKVETKYGAEFKISFDDVLWVRTNKRWPKGIYLLFKKNSKVEVNKDGEEID